MNKINKTMKLVREHINEIKRYDIKKGTSGWSSIGVGHVATHGEFYDLIEKLMPDAPLSLNEYRDNAINEIQTTFDDGDFILNESARLLECKTKDLFIAWTDNLIGMAAVAGIAGMGYSESVSNTFITSAYEMYDEASDCVLNDELEKETIMSMLENLDYTRTSIPLTNEEEEGWSIIFFPTIRVVWIYLDPNVDDSRDCVVIFR